jgi:EVE domain
MDESGSGWLGVVSAEHVRRAMALGVAQIGHGKRAGLARMHAGDRLVYYSPVERLGDRTPLQAFTAVGVVADDEIWQADEGDFRPYRRRVAYEPRTVPVPLQALKGELELTAAPNWGYGLRRGLVPLSGADVERIRRAMTGG